MRPRIVDRTHAVMVLFLAASAVHGCTLINATREFSEARTDGGMDGGPRDAGRDAAPACTGEACECEIDEDCATGRFCDTDNTCRNCTSDADCLGHTDGQVCRGVAGSATCQPCDSTTCAGCCTVASTGLCVLFVDQDESMCGTGAMVCNGCGAGRLCRAAGVCDPVCGDGMVVAPEVCDDGGVVGGGCSDDCDSVVIGFRCPGTGGACTCAANFRANGAGNCVACGAGATRPAGDDPNGAVTSCCGDGVVGAGEVCDDRNTSTCGACSAANCGSGTSLQATGNVTLVSNPMDGDTVTLFDGTTSRVFEFDNNAATGGGRTAVTIGGSASATSSNLAIAVGASSLLLTASVATNLVSLTNEHVGTSGNVAIAVLPAAAARITFTGMSGGTGSACATGLGCANDADCTSADCSGSALCN